MSRIKNNLQVDWYSFEAKRIESCLELYIDMGICKRDYDNLKQYTALGNAIQSADQNIKSILKAMLDRSLGLKVFMKFHSEFIHSAYDKSNWLEKFMKENLVITQKEKDYIYNKKTPPKSIVEKFAIFNPKPVYVDLHPIRLEYGMWQKDEDGRIVDPINVIHTDWENLKVPDQKAVARNIAKHNNVSCNDSKYCFTEDSYMDDLPF